ARVLERQRAADAVVDADEASRARGIPERGGTERGRGAIVAVDLQGLEREVSRGARAVPGGARGPIDQGVVVVELVGPYERRADPHVDGGERAVLVVVGGIGGRRRPVTAREAVERQRPERVADRG